LTSPFCFGNVSEMKNPAFRRNAKVLRAGTRKSTHKAQNRGSESHPLRQIKRGVFDLSFYFVNVSEMKNPAFRRNAKVLRAGTQKSTHKAQNRGS